MQKHLGGSFFFGIRGSRWSAEFFRNKRMSCSGMFYGRFVTEHMIHGLQSMLITRAKRRSFRPSVDRLEGRIALGTVQPTVLEQVFLERINDYRATLRGVNARPFALLTIPRRVCRQGRQHAQCQRLQVFVGPGPHPLGPANSFTSGEFGIGSPNRSAPIRRRSPRLLRNSPTSQSPTLEAAPGRSSAGPATRLYRAHRVTGIRIVTNGGEATLYDLSVAYRDTKPLVTGVVYSDTNGNGKYDAGEGIQGVSLSAGKLGSTTAWDTGGYTLPVNVKRASTITVVAKGGGLAAPIAETVTVRPGANSRLNFVVA